MRFLKILLSLVPGDGAKAEASSQQKAHDQRAPDVVDEPMHEPAEAQPAAAAPLVPVAVPSPAAAEQLVGGKNVKLDR